MTKDELAEIGGLVLGMKIGTHLVRGRNGYLAVALDSSKTSGFAWLPGLWNNPKDALCAIQHKGKTPTPERAETPYTTFQILPSGERVEVASP